LEEDRVGDVQERIHRILLLSRIQTGEDKQGIKREDSLRIWPFFDYEREEMGHATFSFPYLFPFREEGFERNFYPLFRIFRWEKDSQGRKSANLFWGFYKRIERKELDFWEVAHLISVKKGKGWKTVSILKGLFLFKRDVRTADLRLFYLPFHLRWSDRPPPNPLLANRENIEFFLEIKAPLTPPSFSRNEGEERGEKEFADGQP
jgi:hypothetical protein